MDASWAGVIVIGVGNVAIWGFQYYKNGKALSRWQGSMEEQVNGVKKNCTMHMGSVNSSLSKLSDDVEKVEDRITKSQGAV